MTSHFSQEPFLSLSVFMCAVQVYTACSAAAKEEELLPAEFVKEMLQSCYFPVYHVCFHDWHIADILLCQSWRLTPGISIPWYMQEE